MEAVFHADELSRDANAILFAPNASLQHGSDVQAFTDVANVLVRTLESKSRCAGRDVQALHFRKGRNQFLGKAVAEIFVVEVGAHVGKRQHGNRFVGKRRLRLLPELLLRFGSGCRLCQLDNPIAFEHELVKREVAERHCQ